ncbi:glycosyltransferase [Bathymodiolus platifrons methanotrophic gill symbiont]|uniref:glycosyltransferase family 2 protein n=1 Tax=Bathymodiolus platifrons methanotrophic gill symbiont TaxID=113268 RepID=UPI0011C87AD8|nr:glycosyltransferase family 2 protein [Bathymodiolus platifrons methanotrophic gill symbiont]TXK94870.1 glycosyl transferase family 2 [Methylococcaceae bacterium CS4]TXK96181.1 glycosyl transferase family 2 [Methylococcaceae bacterium CS5]TXL04567.1 glycosyl transferase family 2 [Methylococcaceae bacterium CS1]TXL05001.1 glycosyl transferase family 2 [Methylococcaceae bacterium CS3]TXL09718.1 glycosyl transferase family 2 [Methylococcaceae bacterium CS2]
MKDKIELSKSHLLLIPSYNTGALLKNTVTEALQQWLPVWVIIDGSDDGSETLLQSLQAEYPDALLVIKTSENRGKGAAVLTGVIQAKQQGFSHVLTMDADYQHPASFIKQFMQASAANPKAMILGEPVFDDSAPMIRVKGRQISNWWASLETLGWGIHDSLFGMRIYPIEDLIAVMYSTRWARRFDFEPEVAVRMAWRGVPVINIATPVRYISLQEGGVSQFKYVRDNVLLTGMHIRLFCGFLLRLPKLLLCNRKVRNKHETTSRY